MNTITEQVLPRVQPEQEGIPAGVMLQFVEAIERQMHEMHSFMLLRHGHVFAEGWWSPYRPEIPHLMFSVSKSFTSTAVGIAAAEGRLSLDDRVLDFFPDEKPAQASDFLAVMSVRHLLTMTTGHAVDTWPFLVERPDGNWIKAFLNVPVVHPPGSYFLYNTGASYILSAIVQKTTGMKLVDYLGPRLFDPLGIQNPTWQESPQGIAAGGYGLSLTTEDLARFGQLYLQKGRWGDRQILPEAWVEAATAAQVAGSDSAWESDYTQGYGYHFWRCRQDGYQASGVFGQCCIILPEQQAVLAFTGGIDVLESQELLDIIWSILLPAFELDQPAEDPLLQNALAKKLSGLSLAPTPNPAHFLTPPHASDRTYVVDANALNIESIAFNFYGTECRVSFKRPGGEDRFPCGYSEWRYGQINLFNQPWLPDEPTPVAASGAWISEDCFRMTVRLIETPFFHTLAFHFIEDELLLEMRVNVALEVPKTVLLTAHQREEMLAGTH